MRMNTNVLTGTATLNLMASTEMGVNEFKNAVHPESLVDCKLQIVTSTGQIIQLDVAEVLDLNLIQIDPITGIEIHSELEI